MNLNQVSCKSGFCRHRRVGSLFLIGFLLAADRLPAGNLDYSDGLVAHWRMNEMMGTAVLEASTNRFNGTLVGGVWTNGPVLYDGALTFNGTSGRCLLSSP